MERAVEGIPPVISKLRFRSELPQFYRFPSVFLIGRVYKTIMTVNGGDDYRDLDPWRAEVGKLVRDAELIPFDGLALDLHDEDVGAGAGRAFLHASLCPLAIVEGRGRIGQGSIEEAKLILDAGGNIGFVVNEADYPGVIDFLHGRSSRVPDAIPSAYFGFFDLEPDDIISGYGGIQKWLKDQVVTMSRKPFRRRMITKATLALMDYYSMCFARFRIQDMQAYEELEERIQALK